MNLEVAGAINYAVREEAIQGLVDAKFLPSKAGTDKPKQDGNKWSWNIDDDKLSVTFPFTLKEALGESDWYQAGLDLRHPKVKIERVCTTKPEKIAKMEEEFSWPLSEGRKLVVPFTYLRAPLEYTSSVTSNLVIDVSNENDLVVAASSTVAISAVSTLSSFRRQYEHVPVKLAQSANYKLENEQPELIVKMMAGQFNGRDGDQSLVYKRTIGETQAIERAILDGGVQIEGEELGKKWAEVLKLLEKVFNYQDFARVAPGINLEWQEFVRWIDLVLLNITYEKPKEIKEEEL